MKSHPILKSYPGLETNTDWHGISERNDLFEIIWNPFTNASWQNAILARCLMMDTILHDYISTLLTCRLVSVKKKDNGIRPVGADECLWRIISKTSKTIKTQNNVISKTITGLLKEDIIHAVGTLQTCAGLESGNSNTCCKENLRKGKQWMLAVSGCKRVYPPCTHTYTTATTQQWQCIPIQQWQCTPYPHDNWYKHWAMKLQMMKWNRYGMWTIALQSDHWQA